MSQVKRSICMLLASFMLLSLCSCKMPVKVVGGIPDPQKTVTAFFDSVCSGNFTEADRYLSGISISMKGNVSGVFSQKLYDYLLKSYAYKVVKGAEADNLEAKCKVDFTYLDLHLMADDLKAISTKLGKSYIESGKEGYVEAKGDAVELTDEGAEKIAAEALDSIMTQPEKYYTTKTFDISMKYLYGRWMISMTEELFEAIAGGFEAAEAEGE